MSKIETNYVERVFNKTFDIDVMYDITDIYTNATFLLMLSLLEFYYDELKCIYSSYRREEKACDLINQFHDIMSYKCDSIDFMLFCDVINELNVSLNIDAIIEFDDYLDTENAFYHITDRTTYSEQCKYNAFYNYDYCYINVLKYALQYERLYF